MVEGDGLDLGAGVTPAIDELQQSAHLIEGEAELAAAADKPEAHQLLLTVDAMARRTARRFREDADAFVEADGLDIDPGAPRKRPDGKGRASRKRDPGHFRNPLYL